MKEAVWDFLNMHMRINDDMLKGLSIVFLGDGKTFNRVLKVKEFLLPHKGDFQSLQCLVPLFELWHTKWTDLSRLVCTHWEKGFEDDLSTLAFLANVAECLLSMIFEKWTSMMACTWSTWCLMLILLAAGNVFVHI